MGSEELAELVFLFGARNLGRAEENRFCQGRAADGRVLDCGFMAAAVARVDDGRGEDGFADAEVGGEAAGNSGRD
jgi:hypothetical protein